MLKFFFTRVFSSQEKAQLFIKSKTFNRLNQGSEPAWFWLGPIPTPQENAEGWEYQRRPITSKEEDLKGQALWLWPITSKEEVPTRFWFWSITTKESPEWTGLWLRPVSSQEGQAGQGVRWRSVPPTQEGPNQGKIFSKSPPMKFKGGLEWIPV